MNLTNGFLAFPDPVIHLPDACAAWETVGTQLNKLVLTTHLRTIIEQLPPFPLDALTTEPQWWRAANLLAYMTNLYVLGVVEGRPIERLPAVIAKPFVAVAERLGIPPILSYGLQTLVNWQRIDPTQPVTADNIILLQNFVGGMDETWFKTIHINIEAVAGNALMQLKPAQQSAERGDIDDLVRRLEEIGRTLHAMQALLSRMTERCEPAIYYNRVRPFMFGWKDNPAMPHGLVYEGCYDNQPQFLRGETGAQSSIIYALDAALGIRHGRDAMRIYLDEMKDYMPPLHRAFIREVEAGVSIREFAMQADDASLRDGYNFALEALAAFRRLHIEFAALYILKPGKQSNEAVGTGGTPFTFYLKKHIQETERLLI
jgi:indoleamine 2,3-dioxygenase